MKTSWWNHPVCDCVLMLGTALATLAAAPMAGEVVFQDDFRGQLAEGWSWVREDRAAWRVSPQGLEVRVQPGNMWGGANNAKNVLVRPVPAPEAAPVEISVTLSNAPTGQWEQANLVWFYDDSNMVKLGQELVTGRFSIVMGREEGDRARTVAIIPLDDNTVELRLQAVNNRIRGQFRTRHWQDWLEVGECDLPIKGAPKASLHFYNGPANEAHWVKVSRFMVRRLPAEAVDWPRPRVAEKVFRSATGGEAGTGTDALALPGGFALANVPLPPAATKANYEQRVYLHQDGSYGWSWDRRAAVGLPAVAAGVGLGAGAAARGVSAGAPLGFSLGAAKPKTFELELEAVTRLEGDAGRHNLSVVVWLSTNALAADPPTHRLAIWFDWYGKASELQTLNDGYRDYGLKPDAAVPNERVYVIKGFRGPPPRINLKAFLDDAAQRDKWGTCRVVGVWFGNEIWDGSRGATLVTRLDLLVDGQRYSSVAKKAAE